MYFSLKFFTDRPTVHHFGDKLSTMDAMAYYQQFGYTFFQTNSFDYINTNYLHKVKV